ncbi:MAG: hypothetical protein ACRENA_07425, partial [Vulcanimicrobiaceae bacterium]
MKQIAASAALAVVFAVGLTPCAAQNLPPGSYKETCRNIEVRGGVLHAHCRGESGLHFAPT